jgi:methionyl-tRNA formyltransferase
MRVVFIGTGDIGVPTLRALLGSDQHTVAGAVTQPDKPVGRDQQIQPSPIKQALSGCNIPVLQPVRMKNQESIEQIKTLAPDAIVVMAYGQILPPTVLELPRLGCLNLHASLLPRWRGAAPIQATIAAGDTETGITVIYMDEGLDTGDMLLQCKLEIRPNETGESLHRRLSQVAPEALFESLRLLSNGKAPRIPQDHTNATYAPKLNREAGRIDWTQSAEMIERKIRAYHPWPGTFTTVAAASEKPRNLKVFAAVAIDHSGPPGERVYADPRGFVIAAGSGALSLQEVQLEGKRRMSAAEFLRGYSGLAIAPSAIKAIKE